VTVLSPRLRRRSSERDAEQASADGARSERPRPARRALLGLAIAFLALSLLATLSSEPGRYVADARLEQVTAPDQYLARHAHLWDDERSLGKPISHFFFSPASAAFQAAIGALGAEPWLLERLTHALYLWLAALGVILLMRAFRPRIGPAHALAAFVYTFSPFTTQLLLPSNLFLYYALAPWFAWIALRGLRSGDPWRWAAAFALAVAAIGALNVAALGFALLPAALIALYVSLREQGGFVPLWLWAWRSGLLSALTCSAAIVVISFSGPEVTANLGTTELPETVARTSSWFESWRGLGFWLTYFREPLPVLDVLRSPAIPYFTSPAVIVASFVAPIGALIALALGRWRYRVLFGSMLLVSLVLMVGMFGVEGPSPFGRFLDFAFNHSEIARGFRTTYRAGIGLMLATGALLGIGVASAWAATAKRSPGAPRSPRPTSRMPRPTSRMLVRGLVVPAVVLGVVGASLPFWTGRLYAEGFTFESIPRYWDRAFDYLAAQEQPSRVLVLPGAEQARHRWGHVQDTLFDGLSPAAPLINRVLPQGTAESADVVAAIDEYVASTGYVPGTLAPILQRLGVRWVVLQNDLDWQQMGVPRPATYHRLRFDPGLRLAATFGRRGQNTAASLDVIDAKSLGELSLPPVEVYEVAGKPSPRPRLAAGPPLLVSGAGDSWPALAAAGLLNGPPVAYTGAADDNLLEEAVDSGAQVVMTDGNRRRAIQATSGRPRPSPTLAFGEPHPRPPADLFGSPDTQSLATYPDADLIVASRYGDGLRPYDVASRPANAFDQVERTAWMLRGPLDPTGESITVQLRAPVAITAVSILPRADGLARLRAVDVITRNEEGAPTRKRLRFEGAPYEPTRARLDVGEVKTLELRIARVGGGDGSIGIAEVGVMTPDGPLDLREFVRAPGDLASRALSDERLGAALAAHPPRYELRRVAGVGAADEETELRREIVTFGRHRYELGVRARIDGRSADSALDTLLGGPVGAAGTSRFGGSIDRRGRLVTDDEQWTAWEPVPREGERVDVRFPRTEVRKVEVLVVSGPPRGAARSRITDVEVSVGGEAGQTGESSLPPTRRCARPEPPARGCLETHVVRVSPTEADRLSVTLTGLQPAVGRLGPLPPSVVEVRVNGRDWSQFGDLRPPKACAPLIAIDGRPIGVGLRPNFDQVLDGTELELEACEPIRLRAGLHRIETLPGLSGAVLTVSLVPRGEGDVPLRGERESGEPGTVELVDRSSTRTRLDVDAPEGAFLIGGMPWHEGWTADRDELIPYPVPLDTFAAWAVKAPTAGPVTLRFGPQRIYELALALSIAAAAWCLWRVTRRRRRAGL
jgi:arabinofuranan 3-O-arabinosyltransferase